MSETSDTVIIDVDSEDGNFSGAEEQDDNDNNMEQEDNYQAHGDEDDPDQGEGQQDNDENNADNCNVTNVSVQKNEASVLQTQKCEQTNGKNEKKKWEKNKNSKATGKGGNNNQNGNTNNNQNENANNKNSHNNNNQLKNKGNSQQNNNSNQPKNAQNSNQNKPNHQNSNNNNNNYNNNNKNNNSNGDKNNQDNKNKIQSGENKTNNYSNQNKPNNQNNNNSQNNNNNNKSNNSYNNNNQNKPNYTSNNNNNQNKDNNNNKDGNSKGSGVGGQDILKAVRGLIQGPKKYEKPWPLDSFVLRFHYRMGVAIFLLGFMSIKGNWYWRDNIVARSLFDSSKNIETAYENICLSYPYVEVPSEINIEQETNLPEIDSEEKPTTRRYLLYYRWVYWSFLLFAGIFYLPRAFAKHMENSRLRKLLEELHSQESRYDANGWDKNCDIIISYLHRHQGTHLGLYLNLVVCHLFALVIDIGTILFFDFILDGHFMFLLYHVWPLNRNPENFQDPLSSAFPPFAMCQITEHMKIMGGRIETYGIHLAHMEMYEKVFLMLWVWLLVMLFVAALKVLALFIMFLPFTHWLFLGTSKSNKSIRKMKRFVLKTYGLGDIYAIYVIKKYISDAEFRYLLSKLSKIEEVTEKKVELDKDDVKNLDDGPDQSTGNYLRNINNQWIMDEFQPNAPPDVTYPPNFTLGDYFPVDYLRQRRTASTPKPLPDHPIKPPPNQQVNPAFPIYDPVTGQPRYGWNNSLYQQACHDHINGIKTPQKCLPSHAV